MHPNPDSPDRPAMAQEPVRPSETSGASALGSGTAGTGAGTAGTAPAAPKRRNRAAAAWSGLIAGALILVVLLVFILQNNDSTEFAIFFWDFSLPLGVSILFAAIAGALIMALVGGARIHQLRKADKKRKRS
ncbi:lipopolysaccharide assembly protein LapA domain-containing protein [Rhodococcus sp. X156]|uniref:LapA family protein n=1 Tax=Rhodococcus sp. X156 TaxID=2499145 RepID=UPI000FD7382A|nr:lipopolysaccharide assembly protein LapA domain-containing protein [Rhodococcus sp. X156]